MNKDVYIMPIHISSLVIDPEGFFNQHAPAGAGWVTYHIVNMDNGDKHVVTSNCFATIKNLLWSTEGHAFHTAVDQKLKDRELTSLMKLELLT